MMMVDLVCDPYAW